MWRQLGWIRESGAMVTCVFVVVRAEVSGGGIIISSGAGPQAILATSGMVAVGVVEEFVARVRRSAGPTDVVVLVVEFVVGI